jgi:branched-chain amino acid aminotransferase
MCAKRTDRQYAAVACGFSAASVYVSDLVDLACVDGLVMPLSQARIPVADDGLLRGDGVFEVIRLYDGLPFALERHLERLATSARNLRLGLDVAEVARDVDALLAQRPGNCLLRVLATRGGRRIALIEPLPRLPASMTLGAVTFAPVRVLDGIKSLSYAANMLASRLARERGFDEALLVTPHGRVLELPTASFFWIDAQGTCTTPPLSEHVLDSITRSLVIDACDVREAATTLDELAEAREAFIASSVVEVLPVRRVERSELPVEGPVTAASRAAVRERIAAALRGRPEGCPTRRE